MYSFLNNHDKNKLKEKEKDGCRATEKEAFSLNNSTYGLSKQV